MTSRVHESIHAPRGRMLPGAAVDTAQNSMHCKLVACPWFRQLTSQRTRTNEHVIPPRIARQPVLRAPPRRSGLKLVGSIRCTLNSGCSRCSLSLHDILDHLTIAWPSRVAGSSLTPSRPSTLTLNVLPPSGNLLFLLMHSRFVPSSAEFSHPGTPQHRCRICPVTLPSSSSHQAPSCRMLLPHLSVRTLLSAACRVCHQL